MADNVKDKAVTPAKADETKPKRRNLTLEERIAKAEADAKALREKLHAGDRKRLGDVTDKITRLSAKRDELVTQIKALSDEKATIEGRLSASDDKPKG